MSETTGQSPDFVRDLGDAVRKNPLSAALIGMGAVWLLTSRFGPVAGATREMWRAASPEGADHLRSGSRREQTADHDDGRTSAARDSITGAQDMAATAVDDLRANLGELFQKQPLALGAIGVAIGAAVAASLPSTQTEADYLGESSDHFKKRAGEIVDEQTQRAAEIGKKVVNAAADEARNQDLTLEGVTEIARKLSGKASRVAEAATKLGSVDQSKRSGPSGE
jgi:hypothetical protein